jgi:hypothetical protein
LCQEAGATRVLHTGGVRRSSGLCGVTRPTPPVRCISRGIACKSTTWTGGTGGTGRRMFCPPAPPLLRMWGLIQLPRFVLCCTPHGHWWRQYILSPALTYGAPLLLYRALLQVCVCVCWVCVCLSLSVFLYVPDGKSSIQFYAW